MSSKEAVKVMVRVRPFNKRELAGLSSDEFPTSIVYMHAERPKIDILSKTGAPTGEEFEFHTTFWSIPDSQKQVCPKPFANQEDVFQVMGVPAVGSAVKGMHCCIFAYGQTGSGKTYSMLGTPEDPGLAPRIVDHLFERLEEMRAKERAWDFDIEISFMEIYNEKVKDLLLLLRNKKSKGKGSPASPTSPAGSATSSPRKGRSTFDGQTPSPKGSGSPGSPRTPGGGEYQDLKVREDKDKGIWVEGLIRLSNETGVTSAADVKKVMVHGMKHRAVAETKMNSTSSRSHAIFQICLKAKNDSQGIRRFSHINLVDLAGSEKVNLSGVTGAQLVEATRINLSLSTLRRVIDTIIENAQKGTNNVPPYRESMLTRILQDSLGGNSNTMMLATVSPFDGNREDTLGTLRYGMKAKMIVNKLQVNEERGNVVLSAMQSEMQQLRAALADAQASGESQAVAEKQAELEAKQDEMAQREQGMRERQAKMEQQRLEIERLQHQAELHKREAAQLRERGIEEAHAKKLKEAQAAEEVARQIQERQRKIEEENRIAQEQLEEDRKLAESLAVRTAEMEAHAAKMRAEQADLKKKQFQLAFSKAFAYVGKGGTRTCLESRAREVKEAEKAVRAAERDLIQAAQDRELLRIAVRSAATQRAQAEAEAERLRQELPGSLDGLREEARRVEAALGAASAELPIKRERLRRMQAQIRQRHDAQDRSEEEAMRSEHAERRGRGLAIRQLDTWKDQAAQEKREADLAEVELRQLREEIGRLKADSDRKRERTRTAQRELAELEERSAALEIHQGTCARELSAERQRLLWLASKSAPLADEARFSHMLQHIGAAQASRYLVRPESASPCRSPQRSPSPRRSYSEVQSPASQPAASPAARAAGNSGSTGRAGSSKQGAQSPPARRPRPAAARKSR